ncbi:MAG: hypothetical protein PVJ19_17100 [Desulfobacteraceae bacterium]|jgi:hypothetical protein
MTEEGINTTVLRRIWIPFQGASMGAYALYTPIDATPKTDSQPSKIGALIPSPAPDNSFFRLSPAAHTFMGFGGGSRQLVDRPETKQF